jgi:hypothetical protein
MTLRTRPACPGRTVVALLGAIALATSMCQAHAQEIGDAAGGRRLAETWCSSCHLVTASPSGAVSNGAPTFAAIAGMKSTTVLSLRAFLQTPHDRMPDLHLSRDRDRSSRRRLCPEPETQVMPRLRVPAAYAARVDQGRRQRLGCPAGSTSGVGAYVAALIGGPITALERRGCVRQQGYRARPECAG